MRHLKRFQTWLSYIYCAALALRQQREQNQFRIYERAAEELPANSLAIDSQAVAESEAVIPPSTASSETSKPCADSVQAEAAVTAPVVETLTAAVPEKKATEAAVMENPAKAKVAAEPIAPPVRKIAKDPKPAAVPEKKATEAAVMENPAEAKVAAEPIAPAVQQIAKSPEPAAVPEKKATEAAVVENPAKAKIAAGPTPPPVRKIAKATEPAAKTAQPAPAVSQVEPHAAAPAIPKPQSAKGSVSAPVSASGKYDPSAINDQTAQRLARLLVSEIKLYYTSVTNGGVPASNNIYDLLKDPIDKSRQHYKQRMGATVETMPDYFHGELVRTLCAGDASRLGPNYQPTNQA